MSLYDVGNKPKKTRKSKAFLNKENIDPQLQTTHSPLHVSSIGNFSFYKLIYRSLYKES